MLIRESVPEKWATQEETFHETKMLPKTLDY